MKKSVQNFPTPLELRDIIRGWRECHNPELQGQPSVPSLARLVLEPLPDRVRTVDLLGPTVKIGRFHPKGGPVDVLFPALLDHELYRLAAPHASISYRVGKGWFLFPISTVAALRVNGSVVAQETESVPLKYGDEIVFGEVKCRFEDTGVSMAAWLEVRERWLQDKSEPVLLLKRAGGWSGPSYSLTPGRLHVVGRSFPTSEFSSPGPWGRYAQPDWDLSGISDVERCLLAFRHAIFGWEDAAWFVEPLSSRHAVFHNRRHIQSRQRIESGDEIGLGSVLVDFHCPSADDPVDSDGSEEAL